MPSCSTSATSAPPPSVARGTSVTSIAGAFAPLIGRSTMPVSAIGWAASTVVRCPSRTTSRTPLRRPPSICAFGTKRWSQASGTFATASRNAGLGGSYRARRASLSRPKRSGWSAAMRSTSPCAAERKTASAVADIQALAVGIRVDARREIERTQVREPADRALPNPRPSPRADALRSARRCARSACSVPLDVPDKSAVERPRAKAATRPSVTLSSKPASRLTRGTNEASACTSRAFGPSRSTR